MEVFSSLKFWRNAGNEATAAGGGSDIDITNSSTVTTTIGNDVRNQALETDEEESFFDLVFTAPECDDKEEENAGGVDVNSFDNDQYRYNGSSRKDGDTRFIESPKDFFFKARISPLEPNSKPQSPISFLRSAPKFRIFMLGFKKSKLEKTETNGAPTTAPNHHQQKSSQHEQSKRFTVKCKVQEVPIVSLFTRDNSLRSKLQRESSEEPSADDSSKRFPKDVVQKYLKLIKPLHVKVSKRYGEKVRFSDHFSKVTPLSSPATAPVCSPRKQADEKHGSRAAAGFRVVGKHLGKSRSASSAVGIIPSPASRRDDSLLQQHDGIQSAILHCKRSYNSSKEYSLLSRSASNPSQEIAINLPRSSTEEEKRSSI